MTWPEYLKEVKERAEKATPGPWMQSMATIINTEDTIFIAELISDQIPDKRVGQINSDGKFIAHSRADIPLLLKRIDELTEALERLGIRNVSLEMEVIEYEKFVGEKVALKIRDKASAVLKLDAPIDKPVEGG